jgi:hypothetical protein
MRIHNVYSDLLLGLGRFINETVLHGRPLEHFQYNIGDAGFQLDYKDGYSLPAAIINLESIQPYNNKPYIFQHRTGNVHNIPVLYNHDNGLLLEVQEEQFTVNVSLNINCINHMAALDIQHQLLSYIPVNKYMHFYEFMSFLEVDDFLINPWLFDVEDGDKIDNLYLKQNKYTDTTDYSFGLSIQPLLRFNDFAVQLGPDTNKSTFQVTSNIEYLINVPVYLHYPPFNTTSDIGPPVIKIHRDDVCIPVGDHDYRRITISSIEQKDKFWKTFDIPMYEEGVNESTEFKFNQPISFVDKDDITQVGTLQGILEGKITEIDFETIIDNTVIIGSGQIYHNYKTNEITGELQSYILNGKLDNIKFSDLNADNMLSGWFEGTMNPNEQSFEQEINIQYKDKYQYSNITNIKAIFKNSPNYIIRQNTRLISNNIYDSVEDVVRNKTTIDPDSTIISRIILVNKQSKNKLIYEFPENQEITIDKYGGFSKVFNISNIDNSNQYHENYINQFIFKVPYGVVLNDFLPEGNYELNGKIDTNTGEISRIRFEDRDNPTIILDYELDQICFKQVGFDFIPESGGSGNIERIHVDMGWIEGGVIVHSPKINSGQYNKYLKTIIIDELLELVEDVDFKFSVNVKNIPHIDDPNKINWKFVNSKLKLVTDSDTDNGLLLDLNLSTSDKLIFTIPRNFYFKYFRNINKVNPVLLSIGQSKQ